MAAGDLPMRPPERLRKRSEFLAMRAGRRDRSRAFSLESRARQPDEWPADEPRFGFTVTRKVGNSVVRNRIRRRLREAVRLVADGHAMKGHDYVLVGRAEALGENFGVLTAELARVLDRASRFGANPVQSDKRRPGRK